MMMIIIINDDDNNEDDVKVCSYSYVAAVVGGFVSSL